MPAFADGDVSEKDMKFLRKFYSRVDAYRQVFGSSQADRNALIRRADALICGLGALHPSVQESSLTLRERLLSDRESFERLSLFIAGDIGGVLLGHPGMSRADFEEKIEPRNRRCLGISLSSFQNVASRRGLGVVAVANGPAKAPVAIAAVESGCVTSLVVDGSLADAISRRV